MTEFRTDLFRWKRKMDPKDTSYRKRKSDMKDWIKKINTDSDQAAFDAYGNDIFSSDSFGEIVPDDEAVYEAQELIGEWLIEKEYPDLNHELEFQNEIWSGTTGMLLKTQKRNESEKDVLKNFRIQYLDDDDDDDDDGDDDDGVDGKNSLGFSQTKVQEEYTDMLIRHEDLSDIDDTLLVQEVLHGMMTKDLVKNIDLGMKPLSKKLNSPLPKMNMRHQEVKAKAKKRQQKQAASLQDRLNKKEIKHKAKERILLEEKNKQIKQKMEEDAIKLEMIKIRKELQQEKKARHEEVERKNKILSEAKQAVKYELQQQKQSLLREGKLQMEQEERMRQLVEEEIRHKTLLEMRTNMKILHKHFSAWYNVILEQRLNNGRARTIADWKCKLKAWNAWKTYTTAVRSNQAAKDFEEMMKAQYRKEQMALKYHHKKILKLCLTNWLRYARYKSEKRLLKSEHEEKAKKMAMFLEAASKGLLLNNNQGESDQVCCDEKTKNIRKKRYKEQILYAKQQQQQQQQQQKDLQIKPSMELNPKNKPELEKMKAKHKFLNDGINIKVDASNRTHRGRDLESYQHYDLVSTHSDLNKNSDHCQVTIANRVPYTTEIPAANPIKSQKATTKPLRLAMEERQQQRKERRILIEEQKKRKDEEKLKELREKEAERLRQETYENEERIRKKKEEKRLQAQKEKEKQMRIETMRMKTAVAEAHYQKYLLRKYGMEPLKRLVQIKELNVKISENYRNGTLLRLVFIQWNRHTKDIVHQQNLLANQCYDRILLKRSLTSWLKVRFHLQNLNKLARRHNLRRIVRNAFKAWQDYVTDERILMWAKESSADEHNLVRLQKQSICLWRNFVKSEKDERAREIRRNMLRKRVHQWLPDFKGGLDDSVSS